MLSYTNPQQAVSLMVASIAPSMKNHLDMGIAASILKQ